MNDAHANARQDQRRSEQGSKDLEGSKAPGVKKARQSERKPFRGTGGVPGNEGVGEHVRTRFQSGFGPGEIAEQRFRTERRKPVSSAGPAL